MAQEKVASLTKHLYIIGSSGAQYQPPIALEEGIGGGRVVPLFLMVQFTASAISVRVMLVLRSLDLGY